MKKCAVFTAVAALACELMTPAFAASPFNETTMLGWQQTTKPTAMAYARLPFHASATDQFQPRTGIMITSPQTYRVGGPLTRASAPGMVDLGFTGRNFAAPWTATLNVSDAVAWAQDPKALPKNSHNLFESGTSWVVVGLLSVGIIGGVYALSDRSK